MEDTAVELKITFLKSEKGRKRGLQTKSKKLKSYIVQNYISETIILQKQTHKKRSDLWLPEAGGE